MISKIFLFFILLFFARPSYAYIDAGVGSMFIQAIITGLLIVPFYLKKILKVLKGKKKGKK